jgi:DNA-binding HxlR family transcriptional regulator
VAKRATGVARGSDEASDSRKIRAEAGLATTELDPLIHQRTRLAIVSTLSVNEALSFNELKRLVKTTDGNLSVHARKLEEAGYVSCTKSFRNRTPLTEYGLTRTGRAALERYLAHMEALIDATRAG